MSKSKKSKGITVGKVLGGLALAGGLGLFLLARAWDKGMKGSRDPNAKPLPPMQ